MNIQNAYKNVFVYLNYLTRNNTHQNNIALLRGIFLNIIDDYEYIHKINYEYKLLILIIIEFLINYDGVCIHLNQINMIGEITHILDNDDVINIDQVREYYFKLLTFSTIPFDYYIECERSLFPCSKYFDGENNE